MQIFQYRRSGLIEWLVEHDNYLNISLRSPKFSDLTHLNVNGSFVILLFPAVRRPDKGINTSESWISSMEVVRFAGDGQSY